MLRTLGACLLLGGGLWLGMGAAGELKRRGRALEEWIAALERMESELAYRSPELRGLLDTVGERARTPVQETLAHASRGLDRLNAAPFASLWREALAACDGGLTEEDLSQLARLGDILGRYGREEQRQMLSSLRGALEEQLVRARGERERKGRAYGAMGLAAGAIAAILLI